MTDSNGNVVDWEAECRRLISGLTTLDIKGIVSDGEYSTLKNATEGLVRFIFGPKTSPIGELDELGMAWHGYYMIVTMATFEQVVGFYLKGEPWQDDKVFLSSRINPLYPRGGEDLFEAMHFNAERGALKITCTPKHNPWKTDISVVGRILFKVLSKINRRLPTFDAENAFSEWVRAFGNPLIGKDRQALIPGIVAAYKNYREEMVELARAIHDWELKLIEENGEPTGPTEMERMIEFVQAGCPSGSDSEESEVEAASEGRGVDDSEPEAQETVPGGEKCRVETFGRFRLYRTPSCITVEDTQNGKQYKIGRPGGNAAKAVMTLIRDYAAGNRQVHDSSREWKGAFQPGRGDATRFKEEQIFMLPKWNVEKQRYLNGQYCGKWRLWTDEEMKLDPEERLANYKAEFPHGQAWDG